MRLSNSAQSGFTLLELMLALAIAVMLMAGLAGVVGQVLDVQDDTLVRNSATREARFAMQRMVTAVRQGDRLLLPLADNPNTDWHENVREHSNPPVLAVTMGATLDRDEDGFADADNDKDGLVDEDSGDDSTNDGAPGIIGIDDDGDGSIDEGNNWDDDEDGSADEDQLDGIDNDGDGSIDEDPYAEANGDNKPGIAGIDDDGDGSIDEGTKWDDDEDGNGDEDWFDPVVFFLNGTTLMERLPDLNPSDGADFTEYTIADNVTHFRIERIGGTHAVLLDITLEVTLPGGEPTRLNTRVRVGGGR